MADTCSCMSAGACAKARAPARNVDSSWQSAHNVSDAGDTLLLLAPLPSSGVDDVDDEDPPSTPSFKAAVGSAVGTLGAHVSPALVGAGDVGLVVGMGVGSLLGSLEGKGVDGAPGYGHGCGHV